MEELNSTVQSGELDSGIAGFYNHHYITIDAESRVASGWSDGPQPERGIADAILLTDKGGYQFRLCPGGEENPPLHTMDGIPLYKWDGQQILPRTEEEIETDRAAIPAPPPSEQERLRADVDYLAALGGITL